MVGQSSIRIRAALSMVFDDDVAAVRNDQRSVIPVLPVSATELDAIPEFYIHFLRSTKRLFCARDGKANEVLHCRCLRVATLATLKRKPRGVERGEHGPILIRVRSADTTSATIGLEGVRHSPWLAHRHASRGHRLRVFGPPFRDLRRRVRINQDAITLSACYVPGAK